MAKKIYLGTSDFAKIVENNGLLVDKTLFIKEIIEDPHEAILITRPRRWGKTLSQSMLQYFFSSEVRGYGQNTAHLFDNLEIAKVDDGKYISEHQGKYPVIFISFKDVKETTFDGCINKISNLMKELFREHRYLLQSTKLFEDDIQQFNQYLHGVKDPRDLDQAIKFLSELLYTHHNQKVWVLIDEYDTPLNSAYLEGYINDLTKFMRNLFSATLKDNKYLEKGVMTGILRVSKDSMLSGLNNLEVYTILDKEYQEYFGFTHNELDYLFKEQDLERDEEYVERWYDGYIFGEITIYNPWSILSCLSKHGEIRAYWVNTSSNSMIETLLLEFREDVQTQMVKLMEGKEVSVVIDRHVSFDIMTKDNSAFWSLLLFSGYLTATSTSLIDESLLYNATLRVPNKEIMALFNTYYQQWLDKQFGRSYSSFLKNLTQGNVVEFSEQLNTYLVESISVRDTGKLAEKFFHGLVLGLIASLRDSHRIYSNYESGDGYPDVLMLPLAKSNLDLGIVMEFKYSKDDNADLDKLAQKALDQIDVKQYDTSIQQHPQVRKILKLGLAFNKKQVRVLAQ